METAKENGLNPYAYLNYLFEKLPNLESVDDTNLDQLLPWAVKLQLRLVEPGVLSEPGGQRTTESPKLQGLSLTLSVHR